MSLSKFKFTLGIGVMTVLLWGRAGADSSNGSSTDVLTAGQIFETTRQNYASLLSYSDQGTITTTMDSVVITTDFTTRLARPNYYRMEWSGSSAWPDSGVDTTIQGAWSCGAGDYAQTGWTVRRQYNRDIAFANLASSSSGAIVAVPRIFFSMQGSGGSDILIGLDRMADEKLGNLECYQLAGQSASGATKTFWIGKQDLLIHQIRTDVSTNLMQAVLANTTRGKLEPVGHYHGFTSVETYTNIIVDRPFLQADFVPSFAIYQQANY